MDKHFEPGDLVMLEFPESPYVIRLIESGAAQRRDVFRVVKKYDRSSMLRGMADREIKFVTAVNETAKTKDVYVFKPDEIVKVK